MKAPVKIYYAKLCINPSGYEEGRAYELNPDPLPCVEYIHKDALLEWAKETYLCENASAIRKVCFKQLVEKLLSM